MQGPPDRGDRHEAIPGRHSLELLASASLTGVAPDCSKFRKAAFDNPDLWAYKFVIVSADAPPGTLVAAASDKVSTMLASATSGKRDWTSVRQIMARRFSTSM